MDHSIYCSLNPICISVNGHQDLTPNAAAGIEDSRIEIPVNGSILTTRLNDEGEVITIAKIRVVFLINVQLLLKWVSHVNAKVTGVIKSGVIILISLELLSTKHSPLCVCLDS